MVNNRPYCVVKQCEHLYKTFDGTQKPNCTIDKDFKCPKSDDFLTRCSRCNDVFEYNGSYICPRCRGVV